MEALAEPGGNSVGEHVRRAHDTFRREHQPAEYVTRLEIEDCARILAESQIGLPVLADLRYGCRVGAGERRSFEEMIRVWTLSVLFGIER
jgi:hypothetical protein